MRISGAFTMRWAQAWIIRFLEHRTADERIVRLIAKWLKAGIIEDGRDQPRSSSQSSF